MKIILLGALTLVSLTRSAMGAAPAAPVPTPMPQVAEVKTSSVAPPSPTTIYTADRMRDPFLALPIGGSAAPTGGVSSAGKPFEASDFNVHNLALRGMMHDKSADYALFTDTTFGLTFVLRGTTLYDAKNRPVKGVRGRLRLKEKFAELETADHDVQVFRLGEDNKD